MARALRLAGRFGGAEGRGTVAGAVAVAGV